MPHKWNEDETLAAARNGSTTFAPSTNMSDARSHRADGRVLSGDRCGPEALLAQRILPLGLLATTLTFGAMFASPAYTGAGIASVLGNTQPLIIILFSAQYWRWALRPA